MIRNKFYDIRSRQIRKQSITEYRQYLPYALTGVSKETTLALLEDPEIKEVLMKAMGSGFRHLKVDDYGYVNYNLSIDFENVPITKIPVPFGRVLGYFDCRGLGLLTLENAPKFVGDSFFCSYNQLQSLEGAPKSVGGDFYCGGNPGLPREEVERYRASGAVQGRIIFGVAGG